MKRMWHRYMVLVWVVLALGFVVFISCGKPANRCADEGGRLVQTSPTGMICVDSEGKVLW